MINDPTNPLHPGRCVHLEHGWLHYECPGCGRSHAIPVDGSTNDNGAKWSWNGNFVEPTINPSINSNPNEPERRCHHWVRDGVMSVLGDSARHAGATIALDNWITDDTEADDDDA